MQPKTSPGPNEGPPTTISNVGNTWNSKNYTPLKDMMEMRRNMEALYRVIPEGIWMCTSNELSYSISGKPSRIIEFTSEVKHDESAGDVAFVFTTTVPEHMADIPVGARYRVSYGGGYATAKTILLMGGAEITPVEDGE